eukprot:473336_1
MHTQSLINNEHNHERTTANTTSTNGFAHSKLSAETSAFDVWQLSQEQLFIQLQNINTSMQNIKYQSDHIIAPKLVEINTNLLLYQTNPQLLYLPQNALLNIQLQQQRFTLQQQYVQNQQDYHHLQQQLTFTQSLYHKIQNDPKRHEQMYNELKEEETVDTIETTADIPLESPSLRSPSLSASIYTESTVISHVPMTNNDVEMRYDVKSLIEFQSDFVRIDWRKHKNIPRSIRFISKGINGERYMEDVVAMFKRKASNPWLAPSHVGTQPVDHVERLQKKLRGILNKMTPEKFDTIAAQTMAVIEAFDETQDQMRVIIDTILQFVVEIPVFADQYARLCRYLYDETQIIDENTRNVFRQMVILQTNDLFKKHRKYSLNDSELDVDDARELEIKRVKLKRNFLAVMTLVAELYNVDLINVGVIYKGLFDALLPPKNTQFTAIDIEGLCCLLRQCGHKLDTNGSAMCVDKYLQKLISHAKKFDFRTRVIVDEIKEMRKNQWQHRIKKEVARTKDEIRNEFETDYAKTHSKNSYHKREYHDDDHYHQRRHQNKHNNRYSTRRNRYNRAARSTAVARKSQRTKPEAHSIQRSNDEPRLKPLVDEYLISGEMDDILCCECDDFALWAQLINDGLRDRKSTQMERFIGLIIELFEHNVLHNKCAIFVHVIVQHLALELDDSSIDCPMMIQYIAQLFAQLCHYQYLVVDDVYDYFIQEYMTHSQYLMSAKKKNMNKLIQYSVGRLKQSQASQRLIANINKYSM